LEIRLPDFDYFVDSPLSIKITEIVKKYSSLLNKNVQKILESDIDPFSFHRLKYIKSVDESKSLNFRNEPCVIISASGMAEAGRVKHHISNNIENSRNTILIVGYCEPNSLGGRLMAGAKEVGIFGVMHEVHAEVGIIRSMSAHGDYDDLSQFLACQDPRKVKKLFLVHGEYDVQLAFKQKLLKKGFLDIEIPERHYEIGLE
jgi:metallo-beta-lactamase family protein